MYWRFPGQQAQASSIGAAAFGHLQASSSLVTVMVECFPYDTALSGEGGAGTSTAAELSDTTSFLLFAAPLPARRSFPYTTGMQDNSG